MTENEKIDEETEALLEELLDIKEFKLLKSIVSSRGKFEVGA